MSQMEEKLHVFEQEILDEANQKKLEIERETQRSKKEQIAQRENEILTKAYNTIQKELGRIRREQNETLSKATSESKRQILSSRNKIIDSVFQKLMERIEAYRGTSEYEEFLINCARRGLGEVGEGETVILIDSRDLGRKGKLETLGVPVLEDTMELIGGCRVLNRSRSLICDNSIAKRISEEKEHFLQEAGFSIQSL